MAVTSVNSEDRLVQTTFAERLEGVLGWDSVYAWNRETFGPDGMLGPGRHERGGTDSRLAGSLGTVKSQPA